jgi:hypothetical protein
VIEVEQTIMGSEPGGGNCVAACIASIFDVPLETVTVPLGGSYQAVCDWTRRHYPGLYPVHVVWDRSDWDELVNVEPPTRFRSYWIASVESPRTGGLHAIVMHGKDVAWDPHPQRDMGFGLCAGMGYWIVRDPAAIPHHARERRRVAG